jgi:hypothetical protein
LFPESFFRFFSQVILVIPQLAPMEEERDGWVGESGYDSPLLYQPADTASSADGNDDSDVGLEDSGSLDLYVDRANAAMREAFGDRIYDLEHLGAKSAKKARILVAEGSDNLLTQEEWRELELAVRAAVAGNVPEEGHATVPLNVVRQSRHGLTIAQYAERLLRPLLEAGFRVTDGFLKPQQGNGSPMHQDWKTGSPSFNRAFDECGTLYPPALLAPALRVLISAATLSDDHGGQPPRYMRFTLDAKGGQEVLRSEARLVAMTGNAAGSGKFSNVFHGRFGDGTTLSFDLVLPLHKSLLIQALDTRRTPPIGSQRVPSIVRWINTPERLHAMTVETVERRDGHFSSWTGRLQRFQERSSPKSQDRDQPHCHWCGSDIADFQLEKSRLPRTHRLAYCGKSRRLFCRDCLCPRGGVFRQGVFKMRGLIAPMQTMILNWYVPEQVPDRLASCSANCPGCHSEDPPLGRASYVQEFDARAEPALGSRQEPHCHWCGSALEEVTLHHRVPRTSATLPPTNDSGEIYVYCTSCRWLASDKEMTDIPERAAVCDASCKGCIFTTHRSLRQTRDEKQAERKRALSGAELSPDNPHCFHCGLPAPRLYGLKPTHPCCVHYGKVLRVCASCQTVYVKDVKVGGRWGKRKKVHVRPEDLPPRTAECPVDCKACSMDPAPKKRK